MRFQLLRILQLLFFSWTGHIYPHINSTPTHVCSLCQRRQLLSSTEENRSGDKQKDCRMMSLQMSALLLRTLVTEAVCPVEEIRIPGNFGSNMSFLPQSHLVLEKQQTGNEQCAGEDKGRKQNHKEQCISSCVSSIALFKRNLILTQICSINVLFGELIFYDISCTKTKCLNGLQ